MIRSLIAALAFAALSACVPTSGNQPAGPVQPSFGASYQPVSVAGPIATPQERTACQVVGGTIRRVGLQQSEACVQGYADAGRACTDSGQCAGRCLVADDAGFLDSGQSASGQCEATDSPFGCSQEVIGGRADFALCID